MGGTCWIFLGVEGGGSTGAGLGGGGGGGSLGITVVSAGFSTLTRFLGGEESINSQKLPPARRPLPGDRVFRFLREMALLSIGVLHFSLE